MRLKADLALLLVSVLWGSAFVFQWIVGEQGAVYYFNGLRFLFGALILVPFIRRQGTGSRVQRLWMGIAGAILFAAAAFQQAGIQYTTAGNAGFITSLSVVIVPFVLLVGWSERPRRLAVEQWSWLGRGELLSMGGSFKFKKDGALEPIGASLESVFAVLPGWLILSETLILIQISGCGLILVGVLLTQLRSENSEYN